MCFLLIRTVFLQSLQSVKTPPEASGYGRGFRSEATRCRRVTVPLFSEIPKAFVLFLFHDRIRVVNDVFFSEVFRIHIFDMSVLSRRRIVAEAGAVGFGTRRALCWAARRARRRVRSPAAGGLPERPPPGAFRPSSAPPSASAPSAPVRPRPPLLRPSITGRGRQNTFISLFVKSKDNKNSHL